MKRSQRLLIAATAAFIAGQMGATASAATNPNSAIVQVKCGIIGGATPEERDECRGLVLKPDGAVTNYTIDGALEFLSGGIVVATETNPVIVTDPGVGGKVKSIGVLLTGNGSANLFTSLYVDSTTSVFNAPDLQVRVWINNGVLPRKLAVQSNFAPQSAALWAAHSGDTVALQSTDNQLAASIAAEAQARAAGDATINGTINNMKTAAMVEVQTRMTADINLSQAISDETDRAMAAEALLALQANNGNVVLQNALNNEIAARQAGEAALNAALTAESQARVNGDAAGMAALNAEIAARKQADIDTLASGKIYTDGQVAAEAAARQASVANEVAARTAAGVAEANARAAADAAEAAARTAGDNNEAAARTAADAALQAAIDAINNGGNGVLAQAKLYTDQQIAAEVVARKLGDADTLAASKLYTDNAIAAEVAARNAADNALTAALNAEVARAKGVETGLQMSLDAEVIRAKAIETGLQMGLDAEVIRAKAIETGLQMGLDAEVIRAKAAELAGAADVAAEVARAKAAELAETVRATGAEGVLTNNLNAEIARATGAEGVLTNSLNAEIMRATTAELVLTNNLNAEVARATAAEAGKANVSLNNLAGVAINTSLVPGAANSINAGSGAKTFKTLFLTNNGNATAGVNFQPSGGGNQTLLQAAPAGADRTITLPNASGTVAVSASGNIALDAAGNIAFTGMLPIANGGSNNNAFVNGKFLAFDGSKLASTNFDNASFAAANASITVTAGAGLAGGGNVALGGAITLTNAGVTSLASGGGVTVSAANGAVMLGSALGGDLSATLNAAVVTGLRGRPVSAAAPAAGQVLAWDGATWAPANGAAGSVNGVGVANKITKWTGVGSVGNSSLTDDGVTVVVGAALNASTTLAIAGDFRTSWNNQDANSVNPMPRTCALGQVAVARGNYRWDCSVICPLGAADCDNNANNGCEIPVASDKNNCGSCGVVCSANNITPACSQGQCNGACNAGFSDCNGNKQSDGCEIAIGVDVNNCGNCGTICSGNHIPVRNCGGGLCNGACDVGFADCQNGKQVDGCETSIAADPNNCGGCGFVCSNLNMANRACGGGTCNGACNAGFADCNANKLADGCEANINNDVLNCGSCGTTCSTNNVNRACGGGTCQAGSCNAGFSDCNANKQVDGCEINITNNVNNCGVCGNSCPGVANGVQACSASACVIGSCNANFFNVNGAYGDGCECNAPGLNACGSSENLGQIAWGGQVVRSGTIPGGSGERWFTVNFANSGASYHPHAYMAAGANYVIDVFNGCGGGQFNCGEGGTSTGTTNWEVNQSAGDPGTGSGTFTWSTPSPGTQLYIRVRAIANTGCSGFTAVFVNG